MEAIVTVAVLELAEFEGVPVYNYSWRSQCCLSLWTVFIQTSKIKYALKNRKHAVNETLSIHLATEFTRCTPDYMKKSSLAGLLLTAGVWHIVAVYVVYV